MVETGHFPSWPLIEILKAVRFVKPNALDRTGLAIGEDRGVADKLSLGPMSTGKRWTVSFAKVLLSIRRSSVIPRLRFANYSHRPCEVHPARLA